MRGTVLEHPYAFDPGFYKANYRDLDIVTDAANHFIEIGYEERRYGSEAQLMSDILAIETSEAFDFDYYIANFGKHAEPIRHYLLNWQFLNIRPNHKFEHNFIEDYYFRTLGIGENPFAFYCRHIGTGWCFPSYESADSWLYQFRGTDLFDTTCDQRQIASGKRVDSFIYYCTEGFRALEPASDRFDTRAYLLQYPDIARVCINPLIHYLGHGKAENRTAFPSATLVKHTGCRLVIKRETILIVSHEASRSGAPIVGINLARHLGRKYNVISMVFRAGALLDDFLSVSNEVIVSGDQIGDITSAISQIVIKYQLTAAVLNSAECAKCLPLLVENSVPVVTLVHEFAQYLRGVNYLEQAIVLSDAVVFPAEVVKAEALKEIARLGLMPTRPSNLHVRSQGRSILPPRDPRHDTPNLMLDLALEEQADQPIVILGAGYVQPRKGIDLFIEAARVMRYELGKSCLFVWVGGNYRPKDDMVTSVYLAAQVEQSGLSDTVLFVDELPTLDGLWPKVDSFFMSSRLDPFPNVALDALSVGIPVVCFQSATGIAELAARWPNLVAAAQYGDTRGAAEALLRMSKAAKEPLARDLQDLLSFGSYAAFIDGLVAKASWRLTLKKRLGKELLRDGFDSKFFNDTSPEWIKQPGYGVGADASSRAQVAITAALNGVNVGAIRPGQAAVCTVTDDEASWKSGQFKVIGRPQLLNTDYCYRAVLFTDSEDFLHKLAQILYVSPCAKDITIFSHLLGPTKGGPLHSLIKDGVVELIKIERSADAAAIAEKICAKHKMAQSVHLFVDNDASKDYGLSTPDRWSVLSESASSAMMEDQQLNFVFLRATDSRSDELQLRSDAYLDMGPLVQRMVDPNQLWLRPSEYNMSGLVADIYLSHRRLGDRQKLFHRICERGMQAGEPGNWALLDFHDHMHVPDVDLNYGRRDPAVAIAGRLDGALEAPFGRMIYNGRNSRKSSYTLQVADLKEVKLLAPVGSEESRNLCEFDEKRERILVHPILVGPTVAILEIPDMPYPASLSAWVQIDNKESADVEFGLAAVHKRSNYGDPAGYIKSWHKVSPGELVRINGDVEIFRDTSAVLMLGTRMVNSIDPSYAWCYFSNINVTLAP